MRARRHRSRAGRDMYFDAEGKPEGEPVAGRCARGGIPGTPAGPGLARASATASCRSRLRWRPAHAARADGFPVDARYVAAARFRAGLLKADPAAARVFLDDGEVPAAGFVVRQPELAQTLAALAAQGPRWLLRGRGGAARWSRACRWPAASGSSTTWPATASSSASPRASAYRGARITCASLPSVGRTGADRSRCRSWSAIRSARCRVRSATTSWWRHCAAAIRIAPAIWAIPTSSRRRRLLRTRAYADERAASISPDKATPERRARRVVPGAARGRQHHPLLGRGRATATGSPPRSASTCRSARAWSPAIPGCCSTTR